MFKIWKNLGQRVIIYTFCCVEVITVPCHWLFVPILFCNDVSMRLEQQFCWILAQNKLPLLLLLLIFVLFCFNFLCAVLPVCRQNCPVSAKQSTLITLMYTLYNALRRQWSYWKIEYATHNVSMPIPRDWKLLVLTNPALPLLRCPRNKTEMSQ